VRRTKHRVVDRRVHGWSDNADERDSTCVWELIPSASSPAVEESYAGTVNLRSGDRFGTMIRAMLLLIYRMRSGVNAG